jgi:hypothetical protein
MGFIGMAVILLVVIGALQWWSMRDGGSSN